MERGNEPRDEGGTKEGRERTRKVSIQNMYVLLVLLLAKHLSSCWKQMNLDVTI